MDLTPVTDAIVVTGLIAAIVAAGAVKMAPNVTKWAVGKLNSMFGR